MGVGGICDDNERARLRKLERDEWVWNEIKYAWANQSKCLEKLLVLEINFWTSNMILLFLGSGRSAFKLCHEVWSHIGFWSIFGKSLVEFDWVFEYKTKNEKNV